MTPNATSVEDLDKNWDLVVLGGGTAGLLATRIAASFGANVLMVERAQEPGGDCLWTGCVPSKALIAAARSVHAARTSPFVTRQLDREVDFAAVMGHVTDSMRTIAPEDSVEALQRDGVAVLRGNAVFADEALTERGRATHPIPPGDHRHRCPPPGIGRRRCGHRRSTHQRHGVESRDLARALAHHRWWMHGLRDGSAIARLGSTVAIVQRGEDIMPKECKEAQKVIRDALVADGVDVRTGRSVRRIVGTDGLAGTAYLDDGSLIEFDRVLLALGRVPNTDGLGLEAARVKTDDRGRLVIDECMRTSNPRIWAAGDVTPLPQFTHTAGVNGSIAATNAVLGIRRRLQSSGIPRVTYHPARSCRRRPPGWVNAPDHATG